MLFVVVPMLELALLLEIGEWLGAGATFGLVILTGIVGAALARMEGFRVVRQIQTDLSRGAMPAPLLLDGLMILVAGAFLVTPGVMTDAVGFLLLIPLTRSAVKKWLRHKFEGRLQQGAIDVDYKEW